MYSRISRILALGTLALLSGCTDKNLLLLNPKGPIGMGEKHVILTAFGLMLIVVIPVILMTVFFAWRYRASNKKATYAPKWDHSTKIELVVWLVPSAIILALGILVWSSTHELSPYKPLATKEKPLEIQAVSLDWKWLFIYPDQHIATVNQLVFPAHTPVHFSITSGTVMGSFFIPQLGSQIYSMAGMRTQLSLQADEPGTYLGFNSQFSGNGFSGMNFKAIATPTQAAFDKWVNKARQSQSTLDMASFKQLQKPSENNPVSYYSTVTPHLFKDIIHLYMKMPKKDMANMKKHVPGVS